ncbi:MAG TPA: beta-ketoacyl-[acyl-carrier-protein] synthase family protein [Thermoanaerobaculia bacterium]|nr:beta-ketoacyl-[acyl-carrier-protein] synthase family protein [Thermoanaerobaculia bacterium]
MMDEVRRVLITGAGVISPLGDTPAKLHEALCEGRSGFKPVEVFATNGLGPQTAGEVRPFEPKSYLGERNLRPVDRTAQLLLAAAQRALEDSGWTPELRKQREVGLVLGTNFCSVRTIAEFDRRGLQLGPSYVSPFDFANSVINAAAGQTAIWHDLRGVNSTLSAGEASGLMAIASAADLIRTGRADALLAGGVEELCFESFLGFHRGGKLTGGDPVPFDARRDGFALAEGAALLMLEDAESAAARGARVLGEILGSGSTFDAASDGASDGMAVARAIRLALEDAGTAPEEIGCLSASANGSVEADRQEARGIAAALGTRAADIPVTAVKSMLGEAVGASGAFQAVALLGTLNDGRLPGIRGLESTEEGFPLSGVSAQIRNLGETRLGLRLGLINAIGSGGHVCAVVLGRIGGGAA